MKNLNFLKNKMILKNFSYLTVLQIFNILLPLLTYPYLVKVLGTELYGLVLFSQAISLYFSIIVNFGFNITATKEIANNNNNKRELSKIVSSVYVIKFFLWVSSLIIMLLIVFLIPTFYERWILFILSFFVTFQEFLFPIWYFQGVEKMSYITFINIFVKILFTVLVFLFVNSPHHYLLVPVFQALGSFMAGVISIIVILSKDKIKFYIPRLETLKFYFFESLPIFISSASIKVYVNANRVLVGSFLGMTEVAFYDLGEKILNLIKTPVGMLGQAAFPSLSKSKKISDINKIMWIGVTVTIVLIGISYFFSDLIVSLLGGEKMYPAIPVMRILVISSLMVAFSQFLGTSRLIIFGYRKVFTQIITSSGLVFGFLILLMYIFNKITLYYLAGTAVFVEFWVTLLMLLASKKRKILKNGI